MVNLELAKLNPASVFKQPKDVLQDKSLSRDEKIDILRRWAYEERELAVAEEENMLTPTGNGGTILDEVLDSLLKLGGTDDSGAPTKQG